MPTLSRVGKLERSSRSWLLDTLENLRCRLTWTDILAGVGLSVVIAVLLTGFRFQRVPDYPVGTVAAHEVRAPQSIVYEDVEATEQQRAAARAAVPVVYELDWQMIDAREQDVARYFSSARALLVERKVPAAGPIPKDREAEILARRPPNLLNSVRREKALVHSGCKSRPETGSFRGGSRPASRGRPARAHAPTHFICKPRPPANAVHTKRAGGEFSRLYSYPLLRFDPSPA